MPLRSALLRRSQSYACLFCPNCMIAMKALPSSPAELEPTAREKHFKHDSPDDKTRILSHGCHNSGTSHFPNSCLQFTVRSFPNGPCPFIKPFCPNHSINTACPIFENLPREAGLQHRDLSKKFNNQVKTLALRIKVFETSGKIMPYVDRT